MCQTSIYDRWHRLKQKCYNPNDKSYKSYGGRGITMDEEWKDNFESFHADMSETYFEGAILSRLDVEQNFTKSNCFWVDKKDRQHVHKHASKHKASATPIYKVWQSMKARCRNPNNVNYHNYGGRGITYDSKWEQFEGFYDDMGSSYEKGLTLERVDNDLGYCKSNCDWVSQVKQGRNRRCVVLNEDAVKKIKKLYNEGMRPRFIAENLGYTRGLVYSVVYEASWIGVE